MSCGCLIRSSGVKHQVELRDRPQGKVREADTDSTTACSRNVPGRRDRLLQPALRGDRRRVLPVFEAAHIRPFADGREHLVENGLLLRSDAHILFDRGYMTVTPEHRVVSNRLNRSARIVEMESYAWRAIYPGR